MQHAALFQRLGLPLTLIRLQNEAFRKRLLFRFRVDEKIELFANDDVTMMMRFPDRVFFRPVRLLRF